MYLEISSNFKIFSKRQIPKFVKIFFIALLFGLGFDFGFISVFNKEYRFYLKLLSRIVSILIIIHLITPLVYGDLAGIGFYGFGCLQYAIHILLLYNTKYNVYHFILNIYEIQNVIYDNEYVLLSCVTVYTLIFFLLKIILCNYLCALKVYECFTISSMIPVYAYSAPIIAMDVLVVSQIIIYYYVHAALKYLRLQMENKFIDLINVRKQVIMIADCCDKISGFYGNVVSTHGVVDSIQIIMLKYTIG